MTIGANSSRSTILASIREHLAQSKPFDDAHHIHASKSAVENIGAAHPEADTVTRFKESVEGVGGFCSVVQSVDQLAVVIDQIIGDAERIAISDSESVTTIVKQLKGQSRFRVNPSTAELFQYEVGISGAQWGIAETGTLVLESAKETHRLVSLVPPCHIAVLKRNSIVHTMAEVLTEICGGKAEALSPTITFITGPSRTSDIELTLAIGVHGPAKLHVIILDEVKNG